MNWPLILLLSLFGVLMGILSVNGLTKKIEPILWLAFGFFTAFILSRNVTATVFWHGLFIGIFWGTLSSGIQSIFFETYLKNNPQYHKAFKKSAVLRPRYLILLVGPILGLITGTVLGGLAWVCQTVF
ncbi:MAG TPA: hypothetical protein VET23_01050 [Chitinophagaceae bacterium]|nr:hypothetical protein [Chitinophagaceae bacterium]